MTLQQLIEKQQAEAGKKVFAPLGTNVNFTEISQKKLDNLTATNVRAGYELAIEEVEKEVREIRMDAVEKTPHGYKYKSPDTEKTAVALLKHLTSLKQQTTETDV